MTWTPGERLRLWRWVMNLNQPQAADRLHTGLSKYQGWELDRGCPPIKWIGVNQLAKVTIGHLCRLARYRSKIPIMEVARANRVSKVTLIHMERMGHEKIVAFWVKRGFTFG